jgi:hypothetical protein
MERTRHSLHEVQPAGQRRGALATTRGICVTRSTLLQSPWQERAEDSCLRRLLTPTKPTLANPSNQVNKWAWL